MNPNPSLSYRRAIVKLSGEAIMGSMPFGIDPPEIARIAAEFKPALALGAELGVVIGGGNIFRGVAPAAQGMDRAQADYIGMLATMMNALALQDAFKHAGIDARVLTALPMDAVAEHYSRDKALAHLEQKRVVIFAAGTGNPFFTTDTAAALRGAEMGAQILLKSSRLSQGRLQAERIDFGQALREPQPVMDATALSLCREQKLPVGLFSLRTPGSLLTALRGDIEGVLVRD